MAPSTVEAQVLQLPPNNDLNATIAVLSTIDVFWTGVNAGLEQAGDGLESLAWDKGSKVGKGRGSFGRPGRPVAVQHAMKAIQSTPDWKPNSVNIIEGTATGVDRRWKRMTVKFANGGRKHCTQTTRSRRTAVG